MDMILTPGRRLYSTVCSTQLIVVKAPPGAVDVTVGGADPGDAVSDADGSGVAEGFGNGCELGKRYVDADGAVELLCTKAGAGVPAVGGVALAVKEAKPLPASD